MDVEPLCDSDLLAVRCAIFEAGDQMYSTAWRGLMGHITD